MSFLHKEKERLRHQKQVSLLNKVMEYVPKLSHEFQTKVRKLRHLVLYTRYIRMIQKRLRKDMCVTEDFSNTVEDIIDIAPVYEIVKVQNEPRRKKTRAHIVFLESAKSTSNNKESIFKRNSLSDNMTETHYNYLGSSAAIESEYKVPESLSSSTYFDQVTLPPCDSNAICLIENASISPDEHMLYRPVQLNNYEMVHNELETNLTLDDSLYNEKENWQPFEMDKSVLNYNGRRINEEKLTYDPESFVKNINSLSNASEFKTNDFIQSSHDHILNDITYSNVKKNAFKISNPDYVSKNENYPGFDIFTNYYDSGVLTNAYGNIKKHVYENTDAPSYTNIKSKYFSSIVPGRFEFSNHNVSLPENSCDNRSSSTSTERINVETESFSDSFPSCSNSTDKSSSSFKSKYDSCDVDVDTDVALSSKSVLPISLPVKSEIVEDNYTIPVLTNYNFSPSNTLTSKVRYMPKYDSVSPLYSDSTYLNLSDKSNSAGLHPSYSLCNKMTNSRYFPNDYYPLFSSPINSESQVEECSILQSESNVKTLNSAGSYSGNNSEPSFFDDEISYPVAQVFVNCKT